MSNKCLSPGNQKTMEHLYKWFYMEVRAGKIIYTMHGIRVIFKKKNMCDVGRIPNAMDHPIPRDIPWYTLHDRARLEMVSGIGFTGRFTTFWQRIGARMGYWWINLMGWPYFMEGWLVWWPILAQKMVLGYLSLTKCLHKMIYGITDYVWYNYIG